MSNRRYYNTETQLEGDNASARSRMVELNWNHIYHLTTFCHIWHARHKWNDRVELLLNSFKCSPENTTIKCFELKWTKIYYRQNEKMMSRQLLRIRNLVKWNTVVPPIIKPHENQTTRTRYCNFLIGDIAQQASLSSLIHSNYIFHSTDP